MIVSAAIAFVVGTGVVIYAQEWSLNAADERGFWLRGLGVLALMALTSCVVTILLATHG